MNDYHKFIWVVSYPKSGNTWVRHLLKEYYKEAHGAPPDDASDTSAYFYHTVSPRFLNTMVPVETAQLRPSAMMHLTTFYEYRQNRSPATMVKSHAANVDVQGLPFFCPLWVDYAIYIARDPRDVLPSLADYMGKDLQEAVEMMNEEETTLGDVTEGKIPVPLKTWSQHVRGWVSPDRKVSTVVTTYEKLHEDTLGELVRILEFTGEDVDYRAAEKAVERCAFEKLKKKEEKGEIDIKSAHQERFFRRGVVGSHKDEVPKGFTRQIEKDHWLVMKMLGYEKDE